MMMMAPPTQALLVALLRATSSLAVCGLLTNEVASNAILQCMNGDDEPGTQVLAMRLVRAVMLADLDGLSFSWEWAPLVNDLLRCAGDAEECCILLDRGSTMGGKLTAAAEAANLLRTLLLAPDTSSIVVEALCAGLKDDLADRVCGLGALAVLGGTNNWVRDLVSVTLDDGREALVAES